MSNLWTGVSGKLIEERKVDETDRLPGFIEVYRNLR